MIHRQAFSLSGSSLVSVGNCHESEGFKER